MTKFLGLLLEGVDTSSDEEIEVDEKVEKEIEETCLPMGTLIETVFTDIENGINVAIETYEMACIVGGVKVVSEGLDQGGATAILTEATDNFFTQIWEQIKKGCDWLVGMIQKLIINVQAIGKDIKAGYTKIEADFDKQFKAGAKYKGYMFNMAKAEEIMNAVASVMGTVIISNAFTAGDLDDNADTEKGGAMKDIVKAFIDEAKIDSKAETVKDVVPDVKKALGIDGDPSEITVDAGKVSDMKAVVTACTKDAFKKEKQTINDARKTMNECKKILKNVAKEADVAKEKVSGMARKFSACTNLAVTIANLKLKLQYGAGRSYLSWMKKIAKGKGVNGNGGEETTTEESFIPGYTVAEAFEYAEVADILEGCDDSEDEGGEEETPEEEVKESFDGNNSALDGTSIVELAEQLLI